MIETCCGSALAVVVAFASGNLVVPVNSNLLPWIYPLPSPTVSERWVVLPARPSVDNTNGSTT